ncbi:TniQ family protein [Moritella sp. F3]|uniref:TniQ family protein n=1 Tax=Moritella sp. F3 TaxID=2718882 RepID=UPI0018E0EFFF|nr:TniQ family protein [Moritella sp. F3]GIC75623.1 hypothetical protein FMO001_03500 [Moritella sp. F1]GIC80768.1 hypothetical protein FMO003_10490 [Moritella sp. F3]
MNLALFRAFPNEHLFSLLLRLYKLSGYGDFITFQKNVGIQDRFLHANKVFSSTAEKLITHLEDRDETIKAHSVVPLWQMSVGQIIDVEDTRLQLFNHMNEQQLFGFDTSWHSCKKCRQDDLVTYGTSYWHAKHQLPSVFECYKHHCTLDKGVEPVKNLFTEILPHQVVAWNPVLSRISGDLKCWQSFVWKIDAISHNQPSTVADIKHRLIELLGLNIQSLPKRKAICELHNPHFESALGPVLIKYIFRDYTRSTQRGKTNILSSMFANIHKAQGVRNPIYWVALAYWQRAKLGLN